MSEGNKFGYTAEEWAAARVEVMRLREKGLARHARNEIKLHGKDGTLRIRPTPDGRFRYVARGTTCGHAIGDMVKAFASHESLDADSRDEEMFTYELREVAEKLHGKRGATAELVEPELIPAPEPPL